MSRPRDDDLEERIEELEAALQDINDELDRRSPQGTFGLPRPPTPGEVLRFTDEAAIPAAIAVLEANIRILEAFRHGIRLVETGNRAHKRGREASTEMPRLGTRALDRFDAALSDLERVIDGTPPDAPGHDVLADARDLRADLEERIERAEGVADEAWQMTDAPIDSEANDGTSIDIEAEIESIKREQADDDGGDDPNDE